MSVFSFKLSNEFVNPYRDREVVWGFTDAGGNSLGEIIFLEKYSRLKADGTKETWVDVCTRVINGMFSIQKDYAKSNRLPWNDRKAQATAQNAFQRMFEFKWLPPGRGLWMMGTDLVMVQRNSAALQNCFTGDTKFITADGVRGLADALDEELEVYADGDWHKATVKSFGKQVVQRVTFAPFNRRSNHRVVETVTPNHRWELRDGSLTTALGVGDVVPASVVGGNARFGLGHNSEAFKHGLIFADGSINYTYKNGDFSHSMRLCGKKAQHADLFDKVSYQPNCNGDPVVYHRSATNMKSLPQSSDPGYLASFVAGWLALDGRDVGGNNRQVAMQDSEAASWLLEHAAAAGYIVLGISTDDRDTNYGPRSAPLTLITLGVEADYWTVKSIEPLDEPVEVFCAVVPGIERFTLASGIYTSNCAFISTSEMSKADPAKPFAWLMEASMLGIGVGMDVYGHGDRFQIHAPENREVSFEYLIPDTREGWVESVRLLINSYLKPGQVEQTFWYGDIREKGAPIATFGGTAAGPEPLMRLHKAIHGLFRGRAGQTVDSKDVADLANLIGVCVVAGNVRRSAELLMGLPEDKDFLNLKNSEVFPERDSWGWMSNNSLSVKVGQDYTPFVEAVALNGEPGFVWMDVTRAYGRLNDPINNKDWRAAGYNPCVEQSLESMECCTLVETFISRHESLEDFKATLKVAYLYAKTVTLLPTHWEETNAIMQRNRRIGTSVSGVAEFADAKGMNTLKNWLNDGYETVGHYDRVYSEWLCVRESIKMTTVKPSGTVSQLAGTTPGVHWAPGGRHFLRALRISVTSPLVSRLRDAGYTVEPEKWDPEGTVVAYFPIESGSSRADDEVTMWEKANLAVVAQRYWSDNSVSVTVSFSAEKESDQIASLLHMVEGQLKSISFLPQGNDVYEQAPYTKITAEEYDSYVGRLGSVDMSVLYAADSAVDAAGEAFCTTDSCEIPTNR